MLANVTVFGQTVTLTASNYNGYNISCFGMANGSLTANVTGGTPPYTYEWSNGATGASVADLRQGYYLVKVNDADPQTDYVEVDITLTEPEVLDVRLSPYMYPNDRNISCYGCSNGSIATLVTGGVAPYSFLWVPANVTVQSPNNLGPRENMVTVTDVNNCHAQAGRNLSEPDKVDWTMTGNTGTNPAAQFLGTTDNTDFVFKTNGSERMRLKGNGDLKIAGFADNTVQLLYADGSGNIKKINPILAQTPVPWFIKGNSNINEATDFIGPNNNQDFVFKTGNLAGFSFKERMRITKDGKIYFLSDDTNSQIQLLKVASGNPSDVHPDRRGIVIDDDPGGLFNFYIHNWKNDASFNFRLTDGNTNTTTSLMSITKDKRIGVGTANPSYFMDLRSDNPDMYLTSTSAGIPNINLKNSTGFWHISGPRGVGGSSTELENPLSFYWNASTRIMSLLKNGTVIIGADPVAGFLGTQGLNYKLLVDGNIGAREIRVKAAGNAWPDYVFASDYKLKSLAEVEQFIQTNGHLPDFAPAAEIETNGQNVGQIQVEQQKLMEEFMLRFIAMEKRIAKLEAENLELRKGK